MPRLSVTKHQVPWRRERGVRVVHLTDIHVGPTTPRRFLADVADVASSVEPDLVVLTGDYVNASLVHLERITELVRALPKPCIATLGNHDHWTDARRVSKALERGGAHVLRNESLSIDALSVVGVDDGRSGHADVERAFARVTRPEEALVLTHFPRTAEEIARAGAPLVLSGHTHAGQLHFPRVTEAVARLVGHRYLHGFYRVGPRTDLYVNAGLGHAALRAGRARPELAVFDLGPSMSHPS